MSVLTGNWGVLVPGSVGTATLGSKDVRPCAVWATARRPVRAGLRLLQRGYMSYSQY